jgi:ethanolamine utilization protein EutQ (cupin superfamily)
LVTSSAQASVRLSSEDVEVWSPVDDQKIFVADLVDLTRFPTATMTVGYARVAKGASMEISFPYDEVLVITSGMYAVRSAAGAHVARPGQVIYLPAGSRHTAVAEEDTEMVYIASPPDVYAAHVAAQTPSG